MAHRQRGGFGAAGHAKLREDVANVRFDSGGPDAQLLGDLCVIQPLNEQGQHGPFTLGQIMARCWRLGGGFHRLVLPSQKQHQCRPGFLGRLLLGPIASC